MSLTILPPQPFNFLALGAWIVLTVSVLYALSYLLVLLVLAPRVEAIYLYRRNLLEKIGAKRTPLKRIKAIEEYKRVSYNSMLWKFWKPLDSFYNLDKFK